MINRPVTHGNPDSPKTNRHRLNRGGNRRANAALYRVALVRMRHHLPTREYIQRRTAEGKSPREIRRCLSGTLPAKSTSTSVPNIRQQHPRKALDRHRSINALAETINGLYKAEVIHRRGPWRSFEAVEYATLEWVDWFNHRRLLEPIGNIPPAEAEDQYYAAADNIDMAA